MHKDAERGGGNGAKYLDFLVNEVKPFIDKNYRTLSGRENTAVMGSSLGGLISIYAAWKYPQVFSMTGIVSPALYWDGYKVFGEVSAAEKPAMKVYLDMGTQEGTTSGPLKHFNTALDDARKFRDILLKKSFVLGKDLEYFEDEGALHNEAFWAKRVSKPLIFFFGKEVK